MVLWLEYIKLNLPPIHFLGKVALNKGKTEQKLYVSKQYLENSSTGVESD